MGATTGITALLNYTALTTNGNRVAAFLGLIPVAERPGGYPENGGGAFLDQLTPPAAAALRVEVTAMLAAMGSSPTPTPGPSPTPTPSTPAGPYTPPSTSTYPFSTHPMSITKQSNGSYTTTLDPKSKINAAVWSGPEFWVDGTNGNDANAGTTQATAFKNPAKALDTANKDAGAGARIFVVGGQLYDLSKTFHDSGAAIGLAGIRQTKPIAWIGVGATKPIIGPFRLGLAWTSGTNGSWNVTRSNVLRVTDILNLDANGDETDLVMRNNDATVDASNGWFLAPANDATNPSRLRIKRPDGLTPDDTNTRVYLNADNLHFGSGSFDGYIEKFDMRGGLYNLNATGGTRNLMAVDCKLRYAGGTPAPGGSAWRTFSLGASSLVGSFRVEAARSAQDAFAPTGDHSLLNVDCIGRDCGMAGSTSNNGLTAHQNNRVLDLNGRYFRNSGGNVRFVDQVNALLLNTRANDDRGDVIYGGNLNPCDFNLGGTAVATMDGCIAAGSQISLAIDSGCTVYTRQCTFPNTVIANGTVTPY